MKNKLQVTELRKKFLVEVYEPAIDPGGFQKQYTLETCCIESARTQALYKARAECPGNHGLVVSKAREIF